MPDITAHIVSTMRHPVLVLDEELSVTLANRAFCEMFEVSPDETVGRPLYALGNGQWDIPELRHLFTAVLRERSEVENYRVEHEFERIGHRVMLLNARRMEANGGPATILLAIEDVTERERLLWEIEGQKEYSEKIVDSARDALLILSWDLRVKSANETFYTKFQADRGDTEGRLIYEIGNGQWNIPRLRELLENVLPDNDAFDDFEVEHEFEQIGHRVMLLNARRIDHMRLILFAIEDVTDWRRAEQALRESAERYQILFNSIDQGFCVIEMVYDEQGKPIDYRFLDVNAAFERQTDLSDVVGRTIRSFAPHHEEHWFEIYGRIAATGEPERFERLASELGHHYEVYAFKVGEPDERKVGVLFNDISERKRAEEERELLARELSHRVKNTLAVVQALAMQTDGRIDSVEAFREVFLGRLRALARAHSLLIDARWRSADLRTLVEQATEAYRVDHPDIVEIDGMAVVIDPKQGLGLSLVLHELGTNAAKYGALSRHEGRLRISWRIEVTDEGRRVRLQWQERHGPTVTPPDEKGFGTKLIERACAYELDGEVELDYAPEGLTCRIVFPLDQA